MIIKEITRITKLFNGIKEVGNNEGFEDKFFPEFGMSFQELMETVAGWKMDHAWCSYLSKLIWKLAYDKAGDSPMLKTLDRLFSPNAVQTWNNFNESDFTCSRILKPGSILIWQLYKNGKPYINKNGYSSGHSSNVISGSEVLAKTIDGNTSSKSHRDGDQIANKTWLMDFNKKDGLVPLGFIHPINA